jgi:hypothetical protein
MRRPPPRRSLIAVHPLQVVLPLRAAAQLRLLLVLVRRSALVLLVLLLIDANDLLLLTSSVSRGLCDVVVDLRRRRSLLHAERAIHFVLRNDVSRLSQRSSAR